MVSGIGPREQLEKYNITVISDLSGVGQNLHDTPNLGGAIHDMNVPGRAAFEREETTFNTAAEQYLTNGSSPLASLAGDFGGWEKFPEAYTVGMTNATRAFLASLPSERPKVEYVMDASSRNLGSGTAVNQGSIGMLVTSATSTGNVTIQSADNAVAPLLYVGWLDSAIDQETAVATVKRVRSMAFKHLLSGKSCRPTQT